MSGRVRISDANWLAKMLDQQAVVIVGVERDGTVTVVSYGETEAKCDSIGAWAQGLWTSCISVVPFQTVFGWGNNGAPKPLSRKEFASLAPAAQAFARNHGGDPS